MEHLPAILHLLLNIAPCEWEITTHSQMLLRVGLLVLHAWQSESNFPKMFSHHVDNQTLIAGSIAYHSQTVTLNRKPIEWAIIHKYPTMNMHSENRWFIVWADKRLTFPHHRPESVQAVERRPVQSFQAELLCDHLKDREQENEQLKHINSPWRLLRLLCQPQRATLRVILEGNQFTMC